MRQTLNSEGLKIKTPRQWEKEKKKKKRKKEEEERKPNSRVSLSRALVRLHENEAKSLDVTGLDQ